jgi:RelE toxin of RelE / RelB toxin-antitoxin system
LFRLSLDHVKRSIHTLAAYTLNAYSAHMIFVELTPFVAFRGEYWSDEDLRGLQSYLLVSPDAGDLISGGSGLRKLRWSAQGRGKRGGARVIYYWNVPGEQIYLIYGYVKSERDDLTPPQVKALAALMKDLKHG